MAKGMVKGNGKGIWQRERGTGAFQFARCKLPRASVVGVGVPSFVRVHSSLQGVKKRGLR